MNYKKKIICLLALFTIVVVNVLNVVVKSDDAETLTLSGIEAVAATYENSPGNYTGAHNQYCTSPKNATGCVSVKNNSYLFKCYRKRCFPLPVYSNNMLVMKYLNLFIFVLLLAGCNRPVKHSDIIQADTMVSIIPQEDTITLSALFSRCEIVKLNDIVLASINKVFKYDSLWIVQGKSDQGGVHLFNNEGRYLKTVLKWGQGPEEAYDIWSIKLLDGSIYLLINSGTEVVEYSLQKQKMVERFRLPSEILSATDFVVDNGGNYIFLKSISREKKKEEYKLYVYNKKEGTIVNRILNMDKKSSEYISFDQSDCLYRVQDEIYYYEVFRNGICRLSANDMTGYIAFKQNEYTFTEKELYNEDHTFQSFIEV